MGYHAVEFMRFTVKLDGITTLVFADGEVFFVFIGTLRSVLLGVILEYVAILCGVPRAM